MDNLTSIILQQDYQVPSKADIALQVNNLAQYVQDGNIDPIRAYGLLTVLEKLAADTKKLIAETAINQAAKYNEKDIHAFGATFTIKEAGVKYDYSQDGEWQSYQDQLNDIRARQKGREVTLQQLKQCAKSSTTILQVTLNK